MKDKNGIEIKCQNCDRDAQRHCANWNPKNGKEGTTYCVNEYFSPSFKALEARIAELQEQLKMSKQSTDYVLTAEELRIVADTLKSEIRDEKDGWSVEKAIIEKCEAILKGDHNGRKRE